WFKEKIEYWNEASNWLSEKRGVAMYGDEIGGIPAFKLFDENDGKKALEYANEVIKLAIKFFEEFYST
ncbi:MAG: DNA-binding protein, partial [Candidatus Aenigmatarchaeota archaeon]